MLFLEIDNRTDQIAHVFSANLSGKRTIGQGSSTRFQGLSIGTFIFWKTKEETPQLQGSAITGCLETPRGDFVQYILDGQQRIRRYMHSQGDSPSPKMARKLTIKISSSTWIMTRSRRTNCRHREIQGRYMSQFTMFLRRNGGILQRDRRTSRASRSLRTN